MEYKKIFRLLTVSLFLFINNIICASSCCQESPKAIARRNSSKGGKTALWLRGGNGARC